MPRQTRLDVPGVLQHGIARWIERGDIFRDDTDRQRFLARFIPPSWARAISPCRMRLIPYPPRLLYATEDVFPCRTTRLAALSTAWRDATTMFGWRPTPNTVVPSPVSTST